MKLIDTHCHFNLSPFKEEGDEAIFQFKQANIDKIIVPAVCEQDFKTILDLTKQEPSIYGALGIHPLAQESTFDKLINILAQENLTHKIVAIGEIGLDFYAQNDFEQRQKEQKEKLYTQCEIASTFNYPLILHVRKAHKFLVHILKQFPNLFGVIHAFSGSYEQAMEFIRLGFYIGVGGVITYPRAQKTRLTISKLPIDYLVLETDSPYMPICGFQGEPNRPERLEAIFNTLALLRAVNPESRFALAHRLYNNSLNCFPKLRH